MKTLLFNLTFLMFHIIFSFNMVIGQVITVDSSLESLSDAEFKLNKPLICTPSLGHGDLLNLPKDREKTKNHAFGDTWARTLRFKAKFNFECGYDLGNHNQMDWNKLMFITQTFKSNVTSVRLGWRWNNTKNTMELGLYGHINHDNPNSGREFLYLTDVNLEVSFNSELILCAGGIGVIVGDKGSYIKRDDILEEGTVKTAYYKSAYFGGQACPPHDMRIYVDNIKGDKITNWHDAACDKTFSRSKFYNYENLTINAAKSITFSEQVYRGQYDLSNSDPLSNTIPVGYSEGDEIPWFESEGERYVHINSGSVLTCNAGEKIRLLPGFHAKSGSYFRAAINENLACGSFQRMNTDSIDEEYLSYDIKIGDFDEEYYIDTIAMKNNDVRYSDLNTSSDIRIFPNPNNGSFTLSLISENNLPSDIFVYDALGKIVYREKDIVSSTLTIDISEHAAGIYLVRVQTGGEQFLKKVVVR